MPPISKRARQLKMARKIKAQKLEMKKKHEITKERHALHEIVDQLSEAEVKPAQHLLRQMRYPKGSHQGQILSPYLQDKALLFIKDSSYKDLHQKVQKLNDQNERLIRKTQSLGSEMRHLKEQKKHHISEIRSLVQRSSAISPNAFKNHIESIFKKNKNQYSANTIWMATQMTQIGQVSMRSTVECMKLMYEVLTGEPPKTWFSHSTLATWHKDISTLQMDSHLLEIKNADNYGIMVDESKRNGIKNFLICFMFWSTVQNKPLAMMTHLKDIDRCDGKSVSQAVQKTIENAHIDIKKCSVWLTDNTAYMSGNQNGAIALFNKETNSDVIRIGCGLHIMHIVYNNFEQATFGKLPSAIGFTRVAHPYNICYLAWELHDGCDSSDKDMPHNITRQKIHDLYKEYFGFSFNQYQRPIRGRWGYELLSAQQYLERHDYHLEFGNWFIQALRTLHKPSETYINKWRLFLEWLQNPKLTIQVKCLVRFGKYFYEPLMQFIAGQDPIARIYHEDYYEKLPSGHRAHEMPDKVTGWIKYLNELMDSFDIFFMDELLEALNSLDAQEFGNIFDDLERGVQKATEHFTKWMISWCHLPLSICRLGGNSSQSFARSFRHVAL